MDMFFNSLNIMDYVWCFVVGGLICIVGQILIDKTKITSARILVLFVTVGAILGGLGIYQYLIDFAGAGATVPITGFGANLAKGAIKGVQEYGFLGVFIGGIRAAAGGISGAAGNRRVAGTEKAAAEHTEYGDVPGPELRVRGGDAH